MSMNLLEKVKSVMASVFNVSSDQISDVASPDTMESWDSLTHMNLIVALEEEFNVEFESEEVLEMMNYKLIVNILTSKQLVEKEFN